MGDAVRLLIVDCHPVLREGLTLAARSAIPGIVIDMADSLAEALVAARPHRSYCVVVIAYDLPGAHGLAAVTELQRAFKDAAILLLSEGPRPELVAAARQMGAAGWLNTTWPIEHLITALHTVLERGQAFPTAGEGGVCAPAVTQKFDQLSDAQRRVLMALATGSSNKQIAYELGITEATVKAHLSASFRKLGVQNRAQALLAIQPIIMIT